MESRPQNPEFRINPESFHQGNGYLAYLAWFLSSADYFQN